MYLPWTMAGAKRRNHCSKKGIIMSKQGLGMFGFNWFERNARILDKNIANVQIIYAFLL